MDSNRNISLKQTAVFPSSRLHGRKLWLARTVWVVAVLFIFILIVVSLWTAAQTATAGWLTFLTALIGLTAVLISITMAIILLKFRLWQIDVIINRTLVYGIMTAVIFLFYIFVVGTLGVLFQSVGNFLLAALATGLIAVLFDPLRRHLQQGVNHFMYGQRDNPLAVLARLGERLEQADDPDTILPTAVQTIAHALKLPTVAVALEQNEEMQIVAVYPDIHPPAHLITSSSHHLLTLPLVYQSQTIGHLLVAQRDGDTSFSPRETALLNELARQTAVAAHTVRLHRELRQTRQRLVTAQAEERRRVSRALHDGLGAQLAVLLIQADTAREDLRTNPDTAVTDLQTLKTGTQTAVQEVRKLVHSLDGANP